MGMLGPNYLITLIPALCGADGGMAVGGYGTIFGFCKSLRLEMATKQDNLWAPLG